MGTAIVSLLSIGIMLTGTLMLSRGSLTSFEEVSGALQQMELRIGETARTSLTAVSATTTATSTQVRLVLRNDGQVALRDFAHWDVLVQYFNGAGNLFIKRLTHSSAPVPGNDQWIVDGIFLDEQAATPEAFEPGILNPDEEMVVLAKVNPSFGAGTNNLATVSTPTGVAISVNFSN